MGQLGSEKQTAYYSAMYRKLPALVFLLACVLLPGYSFGWGHEGHQIVAVIAESRLTPAAREQVKALLGNATMVDIATWADDIRRNRRETGPWHYVDIPYDANSYDPARDGQNGNNIIDKIGDFEKQIADPSLPKEQRAEALKFLIHCVGDIHQPMHCVERNKDKGGNTRLTFFLDEPKAVNLHAVWDYKILEHAMDGAKMTVYARALAARISREQAAEWGGRTPLQWALESHRLAVDVAYSGVPVDGAPPRLDKEYVERSADVINQQLEKGGVRLADVLNAAFREGPTNAVSATSLPTTRPTTSVAVPQAATAPAAAVGAGAR